MVDLIFDVIASKKEVKSIKELDKKQVHIFFELLICSTE